MICYLRSLTEVKVKVVNDYWQISPVCDTEFVHKVKDIDDRYAPLGVTSPYCCYFKSEYGLYGDRFLCKKCSRRRTARNRTDYIEIMSDYSQYLCEECFRSDRELKFVESMGTICDFFEEFKPAYYLDDLLIEEIIFLMALWRTNKDRRGFISDDICGVDVTSVESLDVRIVKSLIGKGALRWVGEFPEKVEDANRFVSENSRYMSSDVLPPGPKGRKFGGVVRRGLYLVGAVGSNGEYLSDVYWHLNSKVKSITYTIEDASRIYHIVKNIQVEKLYSICKYIEGTKKISIKNTQSLVVLLDYVADRVSPESACFTFYGMAYEAIRLTERDGLSYFVSVNLFTKLVGKFYQWAEASNFELDKVRDLPPNIDYSNFETLFSYVCLNKNFNFDRFSSKEVVALWMNCTNLSEEDVEAFKKSY